MTAIGGSSLCNISKFPGFQHKPKIGIGFQKKLSTTTQHLELPLCWWWGQQPYIQVPVLSANETRLYFDEFLWFVSRIRYVRVLVICQNLSLIASPSRHYDINITEWFHLIHCSPVLDLQLDVLSMLSLSLLYTSSLGLIWKISSN